MKTWVYAVLFALFVSSTWSNAIMAQGVLVPATPDEAQAWPLPRPIPPWPPRPPRPPRPEIPRWSYKIESLNITSRIEDRVAQTELAQTFVNTGSTVLEVQFVFPLPYDAAVDRLTFMVDGQELEGKLLPADEARRIYQGYVSQMKDPALLQWVDHGMFRTSVFPIPVGASRTVSIRYTQVLRSDLQINDFTFPLATAQYTSQPVTKISVELALTTTQPLQNVYSPSHQVQIERPDPRRARVTWTESNTVPTTDFRLLFDTAEQEFAATLISFAPKKEDEHGYFLLMANPQTQAVQENVGPKTVVLVIDRSGSMSGPKMQQARAAARFIVERLNPHDVFNIIAYDTNVESFKDELQRVDDQTRGEAAGFIDGLFAGGGTNIDGALTTALKLIQTDERPAYVIFLTDGLPTVGERTESKIVENARKNNPHNARLINFGVGYDVNSRLLDRLASENRGQSQYVRPDEDLEQHVARLYQRIAHPILTDVTLKFNANDDSGNSISINRLFPSDKFDLFAQEQLLVVGRYQGKGDIEVVVEGQFQGETKTFTVPAKLAERGAGDRFNFIARIWAMRRIGQIIEEVDQHGKNQELINELVALATEHGIVTPYTAYLADENALVLGGDTTRGQTASALDRLRVAEGREGFEQRQFRAEISNADSAVPVGSALGMGMAGGQEAPGRFGRQPAGMPPEAPMTFDRDPLRQTSDQAVYRRGNYRIASSASEVDLTQLDKVAKAIERFSPEYFELVNANTPGENEILAQQLPDEQLVIRLRGQIYLIK